jgi:hypothetical protein
MCAATTAHRAGTKKNVNHFFNGGFIKFSCPNQARKNLPGKGAIAPVNRGNQINFVGRDEFFIGHGQVIGAAFGTKTAMHATVDMSAKLAVFLIFKNFDPFCDFIF